MIEELTDDLVGLAATGDPGARSTVASALEDQVRGMVAARLTSAPGRWHALEDLSQAALLSVLEGLPTLENRTVGGLRSFTSTVVRRRIADFLRGRPGLPDARANAGVSLETTAAACRSSAGPLWQLLSSGGAGPKTRVSTGDEIGRTLDALAGLSETHQEVITLAFFDRLTTTQIAETMEMSRPAASMLLIRAVAALRRTVDPEVPDDER